jgi:hypothetical protein
MYNPTCVPRARAASSRPMPPPTPGTLLVFVLCTTTHTLTTRHHHHHRLLLLLSTFVSEGTMLRGPPPPPPPASTLRRYEVVGVDDDKRMATTDRKRSKRDRFFFSLRLIEILVIVCRCRPRASTTVCCFVEVLSYFRFVNEFVWRRHTGDQQQASYVGGNSFCSSFALFYSILHVCLFSVCWSFVSFGSADIHK